MAVWAFLPYVIGKFMALLARFGADVVRHAIPWVPQAWYGIQRLQEMLGLAVLFQIVLIFQFACVILHQLHDRLRRLLFRRRQVFLAHFHKLIFEVKIGAIAVDAKDANALAFVAQTENIIADAVGMIYRNGMGRRFILFGQGKDNRKIRKRFGAADSLLTPGGQTVIEQDRQIHMLSVHLLQLLVQTIQVRGHELHSWIFDALSDGWTDDVSDADFDVGAGDSLRLDGFEERKIVLGILEVGEEDSRLRRVGGPFALDLGQRLCLIPADTDG